MILIYDTFELSLLGKYEACGKYILINPNTQMERTIYSFIFENYTIDIDRFGIYEILIDNIM